MTASDSLPAGAHALAFRMVVEATANLAADAYEISGHVVSGSVATGETVAAAPSGRTGLVRSIRHADGATTERAQAGDRATLVVAQDLGAGVGDLLCPAHARPEVADQVAAELSWTGPEPLIPGRTLRFRVGGQSVEGSIGAIKHRIDPETGAALAARTVGQGESALVNLSFERPIAFDAFETNAATGSLTIHGRTDDGLLGTGRIAFGLRRATNVHWQPVDIDKAARATAKGQTPVLLWFTGLSGAGKSAIANAVERRLFALGRHTYLLDGDNLRHGLNRNLGFTEADRVENIRRVAETARLMLDAGLIVLASFISPFRADRAMARGLMGEGEFVEIFVDTPLEIAEARDPKGLYRRARAGQIRNFTGIDSPYEAPDAPDLRLEAGGSTPEALADAVLAFLDAR
ncbi:adenylyl-sulfate kinase [Aureimonas sp. AU12]|uniref:adenylyl-sulfate kinase n=1 Tax=Aureimonas sp. AU12 TaxID=1638161 RepID=UPI000783DD0B|nr:adenylyl-sulfate kinase [Aureimonas sp. AU12]